MLLNLPHAGVAVRARLPKEGFRLFSGEPARAATQ